MTRVRPGVHPDPAKITYCDNNSEDIEFSPQCPEQWDPEIIAMALNVEVEELKALRRGRLLYTVNSRGQPPRLQFTPQLPRHDDLPGTHFEAVVRKRAPVNNGPSAQAAGGPAGGPSHQQEGSDPMQPAQPPIEASFTLSSGTRVVVTEEQLFDHHQLPEGSQMRKSYFGPARSAIYAGVVSAVLVKTDEAEKKTDYHRQNEPGMAADSVLRGMAEMFPLLAHVTLPMDSKKRGPSDDNGASMEDEGAKGCAPPPPPSNMSSARFICGPEMLNADGRVSVYSFTGEFGQGYHRHAEEEDCWNQQAYCHGLRL